MMKFDVYLRVILLASLTIGIYLSLQDVKVLIDKIVLDDSFLMFSIAKNIASGNGITYNGIDKTNGFQPLWTFLIVPVYMITNDIYLTVNLILLISTVLNTLTVLLVFNFTKRIFNRNTALVAAALYGLNPFVMFQTLSGMEIVLYIFLLMSTLYFYTKIYNRINFKNMAVLGILAGLTILARMDGLFLCIAIGLHLLWTKRKKFFEVLKVGVIAGITALLVVMPWFLWSYLNFGTIVQSSEIARYNLGHGIFPYSDLKEPKTLSQTFSMITENFIRTIGSILNQLGIFRFDLDVITILLCVFIFTTLLASVKYVKKMFVPIIYIILLILFYNLYLWGIQVRYMTPIIPLITIMMSAGLVSIAKNKTKVIITVLIVALFMLMINGLQQWEQGYFAWSTELYKDALWIKENIGENESVGVFSCGIHTYFSGKHVVDLDGVVNFKAIEAQEKKDVINYMKSENISVWVESVYFNKTVTERYEKGGKIDILKENIWYDFLGEDKFNLTLIDQREGIYKHLRGYDMLVVFFKAKIN